MHATSTPTLAQHQPNAFGAIAAAALAFGIAAGALAAVNLAQSTGTATSGAGSATQIELGLKLQRQGEIGAGTATSEAGSATQIELGLKLQRQGEIGAGAATTPATPLGGRDPMAYWNTFSLNGPSAHDVLRAAGGWYAFPPATAADDEPVGVSHR